MMRAEARHATPIAFAGRDQPVSHPLVMYGVSFAGSAAACYLIVRSVRWHLSFTADHPGALPQKFHRGPVPRIGGAGVLMGMLAAGLALPHEPADFDLYWLLMLSLLPAFFGGFAEDVTHRVGPGPRLMLTVITAAFAYSLAGVHFEHSHMAWLDQMLAFAPFGYVALLIAVAGVAHAMNIIDGYNGLASGIATIILGALGYVAHQQGDALVTALCWSTAAATLGFLLLNYPHGRLFLGDGGAYVLGCTIAFGAALLVLRNPDVSPWFPFALVIYPIWETLFSALRRVLISRTRISDPDARHLHTLVYRQWSRRLVRGNRTSDKAWRNSLTALPFWIAMLVIASYAVSWAHVTRTQQLLSAAFIVCYCLVYWAMSQPVRPIAREAPAPAEPAGQGSGPAP
jgi:UDP-GlcNAc:undecaprenyl-phosphate/decaprenyl-phosphate GlcNAc-1-phosphate transferase